MIVRYRYVQIRIVVCKCLAKILCMSPASCRQQPPRCSKEVISKHAPPTTADIGAAESRAAASTSACDDDGGLRSATVDVGSGASSRPPSLRVDAVGRKDVCEESADWKFVAMVLDRLFLWLFVVFIVASLIIEDFLLRK